MEGKLYVIYPVYYREGYGYQQDNHEGTNGVAEYYVLYEEDIAHGGEGYEVASFGIESLEAMASVRDFFNEQESDSQ